jgi:AmmeMemoRadiSam system radical SAM enzyme/AmmeMemoRadiSam system protein B/AmmeMemoRadiSam system protein A
MPRVVRLPPEDTPTADGIRQAGWWRDTDQGQRLRCELCPRGCLLAPGARGFCFVRENRDGQLVTTTYGRSTGFCVDPIEKKPLNHFYPGTSVLSFGTAGCNLGCKFCQNWSTSKSRDVEAACEAATPEAIAEAALRLGCRSVAFTYNDPVVWAEYAIDTAAACRRAGIKTVAVTAGYINAEARAPFFQHIDAANVDLKGFSEEFYHTLTDGRLEPVLETLRWLARQSTTWLEVTNLIIPRANDSLEEIERMCRWMVEELGADVPLHFSAFHPDFKLSDRGPTPPETLAAAYDVARRAGLHYVYTGNVSDRRRQTTYCPGCGRAVIERDGYVVGDYQIRQGRCTQCNTAVAGRWDQRPGDWGGRRLPVRIGRILPKPLPPTGPRECPVLSPPQQRRVFRVAGRCVAATVESRPAPAAATALGPLADTPVYGSFVSLKRGGQLRACCGFLGPTVSLGEAVTHAAVRAARDDPRFPPIAADELASLKMEVWLLWGLAPVTARGTDRIQAVTIGKHGLQIARGQARGLLLPSVAVDHHLDAKGFLQQVCLKAGLPPDAWLDDRATLMTFEGYAIGGPLREALAEPVETVAGDGGDGEEDPPSSPSAEDRLAAVAGAFYPARREEIDRLLDEFLAGPPAEAPQPWPAALVPHAGWIYSGAVAAAVLRRVQIPSRVIILCPRHHYGGAAWAVAPYRRWLIPGGAVPADVELARRLAAAIQGLELDARPHRQEHAIEVQLPLLARLAPQARVVGITVGGAKLAGLCEFARQLAGVLRDEAEPPLLLISSDMNHFADEARTRRLDRLALDALATLDPARLYETVEEHQISMCGMHAAVIVLETLRQLGRLHGCLEVAYTTSAARSGDTRRVVGYAGLLLG